MAGLSPAHPWRAETRLAPGKDAALLLNLVSPFTDLESDARTTPTDFSASC